MSVAITADQLTKEIKGRKIVNQLSFTINKGEVFGLLIGAEWSGENDHY